MLRRTVPERRSTARAELVFALLLFLGSAPLRGQGSGPPEAPKARLVESDSVAAMLAAGQVTVLDVRANWADYLQGHLPSAQWLNVETLRADDHGLPFQLLSRDAYTALATRLGLRAGIPVVIYSAGETQDIDATFVAWLLVSGGHRMVHVLDGGFARWRIEGRPITQSYPKITPGDFRLARQRPGVASLEEVRFAVKNGGPLLVDARSPQQFAGTAGAQRRRGHIPGAINHPWQGDLETRDLALVWKPVEALRESYSAQGITPDRDIIVYCNTSSEASHVYFALRYLLDYPKVRIYLGSWSEWAEREDTPVE